VEVVLEIVVALAMIIVTAWALISFQRGLDKPGGRTGIGGISDGLGNMIDVFDPGQARATREIKRNQDAGPISRIPDDEDELAFTLVKNPDGTPRAIRVTRPPTGEAQDR
jgi:hypothetical protein